MKPDIANHLPKHKRIQQGSYYTPPKLVRKVYDFISPYLQFRGKEAIVFDSAGGCGAFLINNQDYEYRIADYDHQACEILKKHFKKRWIFCTNALVAANREKFNIPDQSFLIMIGNPPYNDTTSEFKKGEKGENISDADLFDRDLGVSFLRSYHKLRADVVCVLHPLAYLIKEVNFRRLREFKDKYKLIKAEIFSSELFSGTGSTKFPILVALYEKDGTGMTFDYILGFQFDLLGRERKFVLGKYKTTDGYINKYPPRRKDMKLSPIDLYFYTFRDFNSLKRNASFLTQPVPNAIVVTMENFYKYAYLYAVKTLFNPEDAWLYGNLSPLLLGDIERDKRLYVSYAFKAHRVFKTLKVSVQERLLEYYGLHRNKLDSVNKLETKISKKLGIGLEIQEAQARLNYGIGLSRQSMDPATKKRKAPKSRTSLQLSLEFLES